MTKDEAELIVKVYGGEAEYQGGGLWVVIVHHQDGVGLTVFSGDAVCSYENQAAWAEGQSAYCANVHGI